MPPDHLGQSDLCCVRQLLEDPLSALDLKLRQAMRAELMTLHVETGITFIFVTHDQEESLTMSDRIAVMNAGRVQQLGTPRPLYAATVNRFVADLISETNILEADVHTVTQAAAPRTIAGQSLTRAAGTTPGRHHVSIRPQRVTLAATGRPVPVERVIDLGTDLRVITRLASGTEMRMQNAARVTPPAPCAQVHLHLEEGAQHLLVA